MYKVEHHPEHVALLRMDDGKVNAMGPAMLRGFPEAWRKTEDARAVVIAGNAKAFCAGLDLKTLPTLDESQLVGFADDLLACFRAVNDDPRPVIAAVEGPAIAGGAILALCADVRIVGPGARMGVTEVPVGVPFPEPLFALLRSQLPVTEHAPAILQGAVRTGQALVDAGWAHKLAQHAAPDAARLAAELGAHSRVAYSAAKRGLRGDVTRAFASFDAKSWVRELRRPESQAALARTFEKLAKR